MKEIYCAKACYCILIHNNLQTADPLHEQWVFKAESTPSGPTWRSKNVYVTEPATLSN